MAEHPDHPAGKGRRNRPPLKRMQRILNDLSSKRPLTASGLARELQTDRRTIMRDIDYLRLDLKIPIVYDKDRRSYRLDGPMPDTMLLHTDVSDVLLLYLAADALGRLGDRHHAEALQQAIASAIDKLDVDMRVDLNAMAEPITFAMTQTDPPKAHQLVTYQRGIRERVTLDILYDSASTNSRDRRRVDPVRLYCNFGTWYLIAWCHKREETRLFRCDRIRDVAATSDTFPERPFDLELYLGHSFEVFRGMEPVDVELAVYPAAVRWFDERRFHSTQHLIRHPNRSATVTMTVVPGPDLEQWILGWGEQVEVQKPLALRQRIIERHRIAAERYADDVWPDPTISGEEHQ